MIAYKINNNGNLNIVQLDVSPTIYLDHWAWRMFSDDQALASQLTSALKSRNGTLALSWLNLLEFTKITMEEQARKAESLLERNLPRVFFLDIEPFAVISREDRLLSGGAPVPPHADSDFLSAFTKLKPPSLNPFSAHDLFKHAQASRLAEQFNNLADTVVNRIETLRGELGTNANFRSAVNHLPSGPQLQRGTRYILRELVRTLLIDKKAKITRNQAIDLLHAVVPVAYCDLVLLDKHWEAQVARVCSRFKEAGLSVPIGLVFSSKKSGIDRFLRALESR